jgi:alkyl hydroperoxide reductase subunit AhpF
LPSRDQQIEALSKTPEYDMLVIGGGATGAGVAVDAGWFLIQMNRFKSDLIYFF